MKPIIEDRKFEGTHDYVFWNGKFFDSMHISDPDLHVHWSIAKTTRLEAEPLEHAFTPDKGVIATHISQVNRLFRRLKSKNGPYNVVLYSRDGGIQAQKDETNHKSYKTKNGYIITYKADLSTSEYAMDHETLNRIPKCVNKVFCSNVDVIDEKLVCFPYGVDARIAEVIKGVAKSEDYLYNRRELCYANFNPKTNRDYRIPVWEKMQSLDWVDCKENLSVFDYVIDLFSYKYTICPKGNGIDTMRMWESIYCGAIPIVNRSVVSSCFSSLLPIVEVDDWDLDKDYLESIYPALSQRLYNFSLVDRNYWSKLINEL